MTVTTNNTIYALNKKKNENGVMEEKIMYLYKKDQNKLK